MPPTAAVLLVDPATGHLSGSTTTWDPSNDALASAVDIVSFATTVKGLVGELRDRISTVQGWKKRRAPLLPANVPGPAPDLANESLNFLEGKEPWPSVALLDSDGNVMASSFTPSSAQHLWPAINTFFRQYNAIHNYAFLAVSYIIEKGGQYPDVRSFYQFISTSMSYASSLVGGPVDPNVFGPSGGEPTFRDEGKNVVVVNSLGNLLAGSPIINSSSLIMKSKLDELERRMKSLMSTNAPFWDMCNTLVKNHQSVMTSVVRITAL